MSFDDPRQFTNQMAYQSFFSPPGFSFESPFGYTSNMDINTQGSGTGNGNAQAGPSSIHMMPMSMVMSTSTPMDVDQGSAGRGFSSGMQFMGPSGNGEMQGSGLMNGFGDGWMNQMSGQDKSKYDMFPGPAVNLPTGDRFSQLLERKLGMDMQATASAFPSLDTNQTNMTYNAFPNQAFQPPPLQGQNQNWDRMAVEANLQDYRQVQIQPDLVAPAIPAAFFPYQQQSMGYQGNKLQPQPQQEVGRTATPYPAPKGVSPQQRFMPYAPFNGYETSTFPQASPMSTSNLSSPSNQSHQLITPQTATHPVVPDMSWSTQYMSNAQAMSGVQQYTNTVPPPSARPQTIPPPPTPSNGQSIYTGYQPVSARSHESSASAPPVVPSERTRLAAMSSSMGAMPIAHSQSLPGPTPSSAVNMNGMWSREMIASASSQGMGSGHVHQSSQPISRSPPQMTPIHIDTLPSNLPSAPVISKRSRSPSSNSHGHRSRHSSDSNGHSPNTQHSSSSSQTKTKRPKLSVSHPMPASAEDHEHHDDDDGEKKVVIACHTCRARKLKCDGARPKCFHCSRRNEDGCSYDVVLRRRGPGRKNKSKGKSSERGEAAPSTNETGRDRMIESGTRFDMS